MTWHSPVARARYSIGVIACCIGWGLVLPAAYGQCLLGIVTLHDFVPEPRLETSQLPQELAARYRTARSLAGDGVEAEALQACDDIVAWPDAPYELYRWAYLHRVALLAYGGRNMEALAIGEAWLAEHPDDDVALRTGLILANIIVTRRHPKGAEPKVRDLDRICNAIFQKHDPYCLEVIWAHLLYADGLLDFYAADKDLALLERASQHTQEAYAILSEALQNPALAKDARIKQGGQRMLDEFVEPCQRGYAGILERAREERMREIDKAVDDAFSSALAEEP